MVTQDAFSNIDLKIPSYDRNHHGPRAPETITLINLFNQAGSTRAILFTRARWEEKKGIKEYLETNEKKLI